MAARVNELRQAVIEATANVQVRKTNLQALRDQQAEAKKTYRGFLDRQVAGKLTDDEKASSAAAKETYESFDDRVSAAQALVDDAESELAEAQKALHAEEKRLAEEDSQLEKTPSGRIVEVGTPNADKDPKRGFKDHKDFLFCVMQFGITGGRSFDPRLKPLAAVKREGVPGKGGPFATVGSDEQGVYSDPHGGFLVPVGVAPGILSVMPEDDPLAAYITSVPLLAPTVKYNARVDKDHSSSVSGGLTVSRKAETDTAGTSRMAFEQVTLTANAEYGFAYATEEILSDSPQSFVAILQAGFRDEYVSAAMKERLRGTGVGEREGVLGSPCLVTVSKETGQAADTIVKENVDKMASRCWKYNRAVWIANHNTRPQLKSLVQVVGTGGNAVPYFTREGQQELLDGRPIFFSEYASSIGDLGDIILGVWSEYLEGQYQTERFDESIHVRFTSGERAFRFFRRNDGRVWWRSALTPFKGSTLSPFVTLAAR